MTFSIFVSLIWAAKLQLTAKVLKNNRETLVGRDKAVLRLDLRRNFYRGQFLELLIREETVRLTFPSTSFLNEPAFCLHDSSYTMPSTRLKLHDATCRKGEFWLRWTSD